MIITAAMLIPAVLAIVPAVFLLIKVYRADKLDKEPKGLLVSLVFLGILSTFAALITELIGGKILLAFFSEESIIYMILENFIVVAVSEEGFKYMLLKKRTWKSQYFNCSFDGVVYAVFVSLGFALCENICYVYEFGLTTAIVRAVTAVPGHACFGVFMGIWYSAAKRWSYRGNESKSAFCRFKAVLIPVLLHGAYDFLATLGGYISIIIWAVFVIAMFIVAFRRVKANSRNDNYIDYNHFENEIDNFTGQFIQYQ